MPGEYWTQVKARGMRVPEDRPLDDLTAELTTFLGSPDPAIRDGLAYAALSAWIGQGTYDDLLAGLGDGMAAGLSVGLGESGTESVFRRSFSVLVLTECITRDNIVQRLPSATLLDWGDRVASWILRERDLRDYVPGSGWAHAVTHGADAIGALAKSRYFGINELTVLLDVIADRLLLPTDGRFQASEPDRLALATMSVLRRNRVPMNVLEPWIRRIAAVASSPPYVDRNPHLTTGDAEAFLRSLYLQLSIAPRPPEARADLLLALVECLRRSNPYLLIAPPA